MADSSDASGLPKHKLAASGSSDSKRIMLGDKVVAMVNQMSNGTWRLYGMDDKPISARFFTTPTRALKAYVELQATQPKD